MAAGSPAPRSCSRASCSSRPTRSILVIKGLSLAVPAMGLDGAVVRAGVVVAVDGAITTVVDMVGAVGMAAAGATMPGAAGGISATRLILIDRRLAVNLRGSLAF